MPRAYCSFVAVILVCACESDDLGQPCGTAPDPVVTPVEGEDPVLEVVRLERDGDCESFQCLTHRGIPPYCTRDCELAEPEKAPSSCAQDSDCTGGMFASGVTGRCVDGTCACREDSECPTTQQCADGVCRDDDCPKGFWCKEVQEVGPLVGERFCVFKDGCSNNFFCEDLGGMECRSLACFGACLREYWDCEESSKKECEELACYDRCIRQGGGRYYCTDAARSGAPGDAEDARIAASCEKAGCWAACEKQLQDTCTYNRMVCEDYADLTCRCEGPGDQADTCADADLVCETWEAGSVTRVGICALTAS